MDDPFITHGAFSWSERICDDTDKAVAFYGALFGWQFDTMHMGEMDYHVAICDGDKIAGIMKKPQEACDIPSHWGNYVTVNDIEAIANKVTELGGTLVVPPTPVPGVGVFCLFQGPTGETLSAIQYSED